MRAAREGGKLCEQHMCDCSVTSKHGDVSITVQVVDEDNDNDDGSTLVCVEGGEDRCCCFGIVSLT
jgi:hypothetical protein